MSDEVNKMKPGDIIVHDTGIIGRFVEYNTNSKTFKYCPVFEFIYDGLNTVQTIGLEKFRPATEKEIVEYITQRLTNKGEL
jgi:hypothetical protein